ncbi:MarR family winged helix-turn-helix transcriptional regulator [Streptomyces sp. NPDC057428]|uniref:MarR family winged helix-turn-helix transcriptional regulator n=1 Tax=Streptomyces sp. NPDC057428 TaxID=3346129 RepID=UPI0036D15EFE
MTQSRTYPTVDELRIWRDYIETAEALRSELASRLQRDSTLSPGDHSVLLTLSEEHGRRLRSSDLAAAIRWERSRLSHHLRRMESRGLIWRDECVADSRGAEVVLTEEGERALRRASLPHLLAVRELFIAPLSPEQTAAVRSVTATLRAHLAAAQNL